MKDIISLNLLEVQKKCKVIKLLSKGVLRRRLLDLGVIEGTEIEVLGQSPSGDPTAYLIRGAVIALRTEVSSTILVEKV
ncbi:MAG: FeoA family protein [Tissierella sp.]|uniref:FeoA family protein n=1 Tax=Tissierella sp. TaxID=41274 RepID=UPI003F959815